MSLGRGRNLQCLTLPANVVTRHLGYGQEDIRPFVPARLNSPIHFFDPLADLQVKFSTAHIIHLPHHSPSTSFTFYIILPT